MPRIDAHPNLLIINVRPAWARVQRVRMDIRWFEPPIWIGWRQRGLSSRLPIAIRLFASLRECRS